MFGGNNINYPFLTLDCLDYWCDSIVFPFTTLCFQKKISQFFLLKGSVLKFVGIQFLVL